MPICKSNFTVLPNLEYKVLMSGLIRKFNLIKISPEGDTTTFKLRFELINCQATIKDKSIKTTPMLKINLVPNVEYNNQSSFFINFMHFGTYLMCRTYRQVPIYSQYGSLAILYSTPCSFSTWKIIVELLTSERFRQKLLYHKSLNFHYFQGVLSYIQYLSFEDGEHFTSE